MATSGRFPSCRIVLYKISVKGGSRPKGEVQDFSLDGMKVLNPDIQVVAAIIY